MRFFAVTVALSGVPGFGSIAHATPIPEGNRMHRCTDAILSPSPSCSSVNCHGALSGAPWETAYRVWSTVDPHSDAYATLYRGASREIVRNLSGREALTTDAYQDFIHARCAACHTTVVEQAPHETEPTRFSFTADGVSCASCHGDPTGWLEGHLASETPEKSVLAPPTPERASWDLTNPSYGLLNLSDELTRAKTCVGCHVGGASPARDVNHDLIAAGHPRLFFEYTSHLANLPPHWETTPEDARNRQESAAHQWVVGQLVSADAALELLDERARRGAWPEFAEYDCAGCHHALRGAPPRFTAGRSEEGLGTSPTWGSWYFASTRIAAPDQRYHQRIDSLRESMRGLLPDRPEVLIRVPEARQELAAALRATRRQPALPAWPARFSSLPTWDAATQQYLWHAHRLNPSMPKALMRIGVALEPPADQDAPGWIPATSDGLAKRFEELNKATNPATP